MSQRQLKRPMTPYPHSTSTSGSDPISDLLDIVREEISLCRDLVEHARQKTAVLVQGSVEAILESNKTEEAFTSRLQTLEKEMIRLCHDLSQTFRIPREEFTLMKLADNLEQSLALETRSQATLFRNIVKELNSVNRRNLRLTEKSIHYSRGLLSIFANASGSYQKSGLFENIPSIQPTFSQRA